MFSIVMPVWNRSNIVRRAIDSVMAQTYEDFELIIVDDGSTDGLDRAVKPYLSEKVKLYRTEHRGTSAARNLGLQKAAGEYIAYLDSDNAWRAGFLARMERTLSNNGYDAAYCMARRFSRDASGNVEEDGMVGREFCFRDLLEANYIDLNTFVHTKRMVDLKGGFDERLRRLNDWDLIIRIAGWGEIKFVPEVLVDYYYRVETNAISLVEDWKQPMRLIQERYPKPAEPIIYEHDAIKYTWRSLPDRKYRNYWQRLQPGVINRLDYRAYGQPLVIQIEPTNMCNLQCPLCPVARKALKREPRHMEVEEFRKIVDDVQNHVLLLVLWDWGEPFMNPALPEMIRYATDKGIRTVTSTNAHFLSDKTRVEEILRSGLSTLIVAIDSLHADIYQAYRQKGSLDRALLGLRNAIEIKRRTGSSTVINFRMVVMRQNEHEVGRTKRLARQMGADVFSVKTLNPICGELALDSELVPTNGRYQRLEYQPGTWQRVPIDRDCENPWLMANIFSDGSVVPCCYDFDATMVVGNAFDQPFGRIWNGPAFVELRKRVLKDRANLPRCTQCLINYKEKQGMFCYSVNFTEKTEVAVMLRSLYGRLPEPLRMGARHLKSLYQWGNAAIKSVTSASSPIGPQEGLLTSRVHPLQIPLLPEGGGGLRSYSVFNGFTKQLTSMACHVSVLMNEYSPHPAHTHKEEELLLVLDGQVDLIMPGEPTLEGVQRIHLKPRQFVYYPAGFAHSLRTVSAKPANYLMLKWYESPLPTDSQLPFSLYDISNPGQDCPGTNGFRPQLLFEGPTAYLRKLHCHLSALDPGAGYAPHADPYEVAIIVLEGEIKTLGKRVRPHGVVFYRAGEPHGLRNPGKITAHYIVFEFHRQVA